MTRFYRPDKSFPAETLDTSGTNNKRLQYGCDCVTVPRLVCCSGKVLSGSAFSDL